MPNEFHDIDKGYEELVGKFDDFAEDGPTVTVGVHAEDSSREAEVDGATSINLAWLMAIHEWGLGVPERSILRATLDQNEKRYVRIQRLAYGTVLDGKHDFEWALAVLGQAVKGDMQDRFGDKSELAPLAEVTIEAKSTSAGRGDAPLIDTGQLKQSIDYQVDAD